MPLLDVAGPPTAIIGLAPSAIAIRRIEIKRAPGVTVGRVFEDTATVADHCECVPKAAAVLT
jgi:hypothetical protein